MAEQEEHTGIVLALTSFDAGTLADIEKELKSGVDERVSVNSYVQNAMELPDLVSVIITNWVVPSLSWDLLKAIIKQVVAAVRSRGKEVQKNVWVSVTVSTKTGKKKVINLYISADNPEDAINSMSEKLTPEFLQDITDESLVSLEYVDDKVKVHVI